VGRATLVTGVVQLVVVDGVQCGRDERGLADSTSAVHHEELSLRPVEVRHQPVELRVAIDQYARDHIIACILRVDGGYGLSVALCPVT